VPAQTVRKPFLKLEIAGAGSGGGRADAPPMDAAAEQTAPCATPRASDPNFLQRLVLPCALPLDAAFAPVLRVAAHDRWLGGLSTPLIGMLPSVSCRAVSCHFMVPCRVVPCRVTVPWWHVVPCRVASFHGGMSCRVVSCHFVVSCRALPLAGSCGSLSRARETEHAKPSSPQARPRSISPNAHHITFHCVPLHRIAFPFHSIPFLSFPFHSIPFLSIPFDSIPFHSIPFHSIPFHSIPFHSIPVTFHAITLHYIALHYIALHCITLQTWNDQDPQEKEDYEIKGMQVRVM